MMPPIAVIIPVFLLFGAIGWVDTHQGLILLYAAFNLPLAIWMMRAYFLDVPVEIEEAALVDGSSRLGALWHITLPLAAPGVAATAVFLFIFSWTEFLFALVLARTNAVTLPVIIAGFYGMQSTFWGAAGVVSILACVPIFILGLAAHRHFARGLTMGAVRG
jgi:multiple sugar transport system permease protein